MTMPRLSGWVVGLIVVVVAASAQAQSENSVRGAVGISGGYHFDAEAPLVGVDGLFTFETGAVPISIQPSFNYFFLDSQEFLGLEITRTLLQFDLNALVHLPLSAPVTPFMGA